MALHWQWSQKIGEAIMLSNGAEFTLDLYEGNAFLIFIRKYEENGNMYYALHSFFADRQHMLNCLGLTKGLDSIFTTYTQRPVAIKLSCEHSKAVEIATAFARWSKKYSLPISITLVPHWEQ